MYCVHMCSVSVMGVVPSFEFSLRFILTEVLKVLLNLPFAFVQSIPGRLPGSGCSPFILPK